MKLFSKEHYDLIAGFEQYMKGGDFRKEDQSMWGKHGGCIYCNGEMSEKYKAYEAGYELGRYVYQER